MESEISGVWMIYSSDICMGDSYSYYREELVFKSKDDARKFISRNNYTNSKPVFIEFRTMV